MKIIICSVVALGLLPPSLGFITNSQTRLQTSPKGRTIYQPVSNHELHSIAADISTSPVKSVGADTDESESNMLFQDLTGGNIATSPVFYAVEGLFMFGLLMLIKGGYTGEALQVGALHALSAAASAAIAEKWKDTSPMVPLVRGLLGGPIEIVRIALADDKETALERGLVNGPPMQMVVDSTDIGMASTPRGFVLSTQIKCKQEGVAHMLKLLKTFLEEVQGGQRELVTSISVNQDPEDRTNFIVIQRFPSQDAMIAHQSTVAFKEFTELSRDVLTKPMGLYLAGEKAGVLTEAIYPFGPGGEGGRDDSIYSSPVNIDSSGI